MASGFELTDWERRREWYSVIQLGKDVASQTALLEEQAEEMIAAQYATANAILVSQESIREGINHLAYRVEEGMYGLKAAFEFGISEVVWQIEQNRQVLKNILEVLMAPLDTQAKELRHRAEDAYSNGWIDEALEDFLESEKKNKYDFSVHISIGMIYLFQKVDREKSLEYFEKGAKYAKPKSSYHASFALLHAALIKRDLNLMADAESLTAEAVSLSPDFAEALYQNAQYNAQLGQATKSIMNLEKAVMMDCNYSLKADIDSMFDPVRVEVNKLFSKLRDEMSNLTVNTFQPVAYAVNTTNDYIQKNISRLDSAIIQVESFSYDLSEIDKKLKRNSYFDTVSAKSTANKYFENAKSYINTTEKTLNSYFTNTIKNIDSTIINSQNSVQSETQTKRDRITGIIPILACWAFLVHMWLFIGILINTNTDQFEPIMYIISLILFSTIVFGWFISQSLLTAFANILFPDKNFRQSNDGIAKIRQKDELKKQHDNMQAFFADVKRALP